MKASSVPAPPSLLPRQFGRICSIARATPRFISERTEPLLKITSLSTQLTELSAHSPI